MSTPGWYPDPGGAQGHYRYWDGTAWATTTSQDPFGTAGQPMAPGGSPSPRSSLGTPQAPVGAPLATASGWKTLGWWLLMLAIIGALIFGGLQLLRGTGLLPNSAPNSNPTQDLCPRSDPTNAMIPPTITADGRVQGGKLSYPQLGAPWSAPEAELRMAFGRGVYTQNVPIWPGYDGRNSWVASVLVGELVAGDGFFSPEQGTEMVVKCAIGSFYGDAAVTRNDKVSKAVTVSGKEGWVLETHLSFDIPKLPEKGETAIFLIVRTSEASSSIYYASIPDSTPELLTTARQVQSQLRVEP